MLFTSAAKAVSKQLRTCTAEAVLHPEPRVVRLGVLTGQQIPWGLKRLAQLVSPLRGSAIFHTHPRDLHPGLTAKLPLRGSWAEIRYLVATTKSNFRLRHNL